MRRGEERSGQVRRLRSGAAGPGMDRQGEAVLVISVRLGLVVFDTVGLGGYGAAGTSLVWRIEAGRLWTVGRVEVRQGRAVMVRWGEV